MHWQQAEKSWLLCHATSQSKLLCSASPWSVLPGCATFQPWLPDVASSAHIPLFSSTHAPLFTVLQRGTVNVYHSSALLESWLDDLTELWLQQGSAPNPQDVATHVS